MAAKVQQPASFRVVRIMKLLRKTGEGIRRILRRSRRALKIQRGQAGACMTVPQTLQVRCAKLE